MKIDYSIRIPATNERLNLLEEKTFSRQSLPRIKDILFKPVGVDLKNFHPNDVAIRLREFTDEDKLSTLCKFIFIKVESGYTDQREDLGVGTTEKLFQKAQELGYEKWGELSMHSIEYNLDLENDKVKVLSQEITPLGTILKIESETQEGLNKTLELLSVSKSEKIEKNAALLLAERKGII